jgi:signal transduction histidine kinase
MFDDGVERHNGPVGDVAAGRAPAASVVGWSATAALTALAGLVALASSASTLDTAPEVTWPRAWLVVEVSVGIIVLLGTWAATFRRPTVAVGLAVLGGAVALPVFAAVTALPLTVRAALAATATLAPAGAVFVVGGWSRCGRRWMVVAAGSSAAAALAHVLTLDPATEPACLRLCLSSDVVVDGIGSRQALGIVTVLVLLSLLLAVRAATNPECSLPTYSRVAVIAGAALIALPWVVRWLSWWSRTMVTEAQLYGVVGVGVVAAAVLVTTTREVLLRQRVTALASDLAGPRRSRVAIELARPGTGEWLTPLGDPAPDMATTPYRVVTENGQPVARWPATGRSVEMHLSPATRLGLRNAQLGAGAAAQLRDLRESQRRIITAADVERSRIERDLHDGVQQRLVGALLALAARAAHEPQHAPADVASAEIRLALTKLRALTGGLVNPVLVSDGLWAALDDLSMTGPTEVDVSLTGDEPTDPETCRAAYHVISEATRLLVTETGSVSVKAATDAATLRLTVDSPAWVAVRPERLTDLADRVGAAGGSFSLAADVGRLEVVLPCGS